MAAPAAPIQPVFQDVFFDVLISLNSVLNPDEFDVLKGELEAFSEEYRHRHYTACGLRIGRTLEYVVYALARAWGVNVNRTSYRFCRASMVLSTSCPRPSLITRHRKANKKSQSRTRFRNSENVSRRLWKLVFELDSDLRPENTEVPINVESILRDIKKQFRRRAKVLNAINAVIESQITRKILESRNAAAHGSTSGMRRELTRSDIDNSVELLRTALMLFTNVAFAVAEKEN